MKLALYGTLTIGEIDSALAASGSNVMAQVRRAFKPGCQESLTVSSSLEYYKHYSGCTGVLLPDFVRAKKRDAGLKMALSDATLSSLRSFMAGTDMAADTAPVAVTNQTLNAQTGSGAMKAGDVYPLGRMNITSLSLTGNGVALAAGTDYTLDAVHGEITFLVDITGPVVAASYSYQNPRGTALFNAAEKDYVVFMQGYNADGGQPGQFCGYKCKLSLDGDLELFTTEASLINCTGDMQLDSSKTAGGLLGQFGFIRGFGLPA